MKEIAKSNGIKNVALPVRPTLKWQFPLIPIDEYINWENSEGLPYDPWIRVHKRAEIGTDSWLKEKPAI